jgi:hypothetical protein
MGTDLLPVIVPDHARISRENPHFERNSGKLEDTGRAACGGRSGRKNSYRSVPQIVCFAAGAAIPGEPSSEVVVAPNRPPHVGRRQSNGPERLFQDGFGGDRQPVLQEGGVDFTKANVHFEVACVEIGQRRVSIENATAHRRTLRAQRDTGWKFWHPRVLPHFT